MDFEQIFVSMGNMGVLDVLIPLFLVFAIVFATLSKTKMFNARISGVIGFMMGLAVVIPHVMGVYPACWDVVEIIKGALPNVALAIIGVIFFFVLVGVIGLKMEFLDKIVGVIALAAFAFVLFTFTTARGPGCTVVSVGNTGPWLDLIIVGAVFGGLGWWILKK